MPGLVAEEPPTASTSTSSHSPPNDSSFFPPITITDLLACRFSSWYPTFRRISPKATIIRPMEERFIQYLESDRVFLPEGSGPLGVSELSDDEESGNGSESEEDESWQVKFEELDARIREIIIKYDGAIFPKLNWTSPQDASWMVPGPALKCQSPADVYLLLKSSDFVSNDLDQAFAHCVDYAPTPTSSLSQERIEEGVSGLALGVETRELRDESEDEEKEVHSPPPKTERIARPYDFELVLKKWFDMPKSQEWRCFVRDKELIGISQRDNNYYDFLQSADTQQTIRVKVATFFKDEIRDKFPSSSYTFDVYFTRSNEKIFLIDFNPYSPRTDSLLFDWSTLHSLSSSLSTSSSSPLQSELSLPILRLITSSTMASQTLPQYSHNRYPKDVVDLSNGRSIAEFAEKYRDALAKATCSDGEESVGR